MSFASNGSDPRSTLIRMALAMQVQERAGWKWLGTGMPGPNGTSATARRPWHAAQGDAGVVC